MKVVAEILVLVVTAQNTDELISDVDFGAIVLIRTAAHFQGLAVEAAAEEGLKLVDFLLVHNVSHMWPFAV
jgi:predicted MarR family transcription regulator